MPETGVPKVPKGAVMGDDIPPLPPPPYAQPEPRSWQRQALLSGVHGDAGLPLREKLLCHYCSNVIARIAGGRLYETNGTNPKTGARHDAFPCGIMCKNPNCKDPRNLLSLEYLPGLKEAMGPPVFRAPKAKPPKTVKQYATEHRRVRRVRPRFTAPTPE